MITTATIETKLGPMIACSVDEGICLLEFRGRKILPEEYKYIEKAFNSQISEGESDHLVSLRKQLTLYFEGELKEFTIPLVISGTEFQKKVWNGLMSIGYGTTRSYLQQSAALGMPGSVRAVANANGQNRIAIMIPCHRVIGHNGRLTGYGGGLERKRWLLEHEKIHSGKNVELTLF